MSNNDKIFSAMINKNGIVLEEEKKTHRHRNEKWKIDAVNRSKCMNGMLAQHLYMRLYFANIISRNNIIKWMFVECSDGIIHSTHATSFLVDYLVIVNINKKIFI